MTSKKSFRALLASLATLVLFAACGHRGAPTGAQPSASAMAGAHMAPSASPRVLPPAPVATAVTGSPFRGTVATDHSGRIVLGPSGHVSTAPPVSTAVGPNGKPRVLFGATGDSTVQIVGNNIVMPSGGKVTNLGAPTAGGDAVNKTYADALGLTESALRTTAATLTASLPVNGQKITGLGTPTTGTDAATKAYADSVGGAVTESAVRSAAATFTASLIVNSRNVSSMASAVADTDAVNKLDLDQIGYHGAVLVYSESLPAYTYANGGSAGVGATITMNVTGVVTVDGHAMALADSILVNDGTVAGGKYKCTVAPAVGVAGVFTRATSSDTPAKLRGATYKVLKGTVFAGTEWVLASLDTADITIGTTLLPWTAPNMSRVPLNKLGAPVAAVAGNGQEATGWANPTAAQSLVTRNWAQTAWRPRGQFGLSNFEEFDYAASSATMSTSVASPGGYISTVSGAGAAVQLFGATGGVNNATVIGVAQLTPGTSTTGIAAVVRVGSAGGSGLHYVPTAAQDAASINVKIESASTGTDTFAALIGYFSSTSASPTNGAWFSADANSDPHWICNVAVGGVKTSFTTSVVATAAQVFHLQPVKLPGADIWSFYIDGVLANPSNPLTGPNAALMALTAASIKTAGTTASKGLVTIDWIGEDYTYTRAAGWSP